MWSSLDANVRTVASKVSAACRGTIDSYTAFRRLAGARPALVEQLLRRGLGAVVSDASSYKAQRLCTVPEWHCDNCNVHCIHCTATSLVGHARPAFSVEAITAVTVPFPSACNIMSATDHSADLCNTVLPPPRCCQMCTRCGYDRWRRCWRRTRQPTFSWQPTAPPTRRAMYVCRRSQARMSREVEDRGGC